MDADDEPAMAYFLPNGIADDSPPKQSRLKASFGPIGGRFAAAASSQSTAASPASAAPVSAASGAPNVRSDVEFSNLHTRPRPTLEPPPFGASGGGAASPRPTNFLLSDLGGEIHTPRASGGSTPTSSRPFGFPGPFGPALGDASAIGRAGAIRSPTASMFDRGQDAAKSFSMQGDGRRSLTAASPSSTYGSEAQQLYPPRTTNLSSYLGAADPDSPFGGGSMSTWPSAATEVSQPRRVLQRPPGLAGPPGLSEPSAMEGMQPHMRLGSAGDMRQQRVAAPQFGPFRPPTSSPVAAGGANHNRAFSSGEDQYGPSLLSSLRLSSGVFGDSPLRDQTPEGRGVSNPELAELNTHSMKMDGMRIRRAVDSPSAPWENREPTASRRIDIQAKSKTPRSPKKTREARRKSEGRSDLRAKALEFSMDAINAFTPGSPMRPKRTDRGRKMTPSASGYENSLSSVENTRDHSAPRGKRRNQPADKTAGTAFVGAAGSDNWRKGATNQIDEPSSTRGPPPGLETDGSPLKLTSREASKPRRREDNKPATRSTTSRRNSTRGNDKGASTTRRQVYREKQVKEIVKEASLTEDVAPLPSAALQSPRKSQSRSDSPTFSKIPEKKATIAQNAKDKDHAASPAKSAAAVPKAAKPTDVSTEVPAEVAKTTAIQSPAIERVEATSAERESSSSSDGPEDAQDAVNEQSESCQERVVDSPESDDILSHVESSEDDTEQCQVSTQKLPTTLSKKSKRRSGALTAASADSSAASPQTEAEPFSAHEPISTPLVEKKHGTKEHRKERSKKEKGEKKKPTRGKKDKKVVSKTADAVSGSASEAQDKILEDLATRGTPLSARISQGLRKGGSAAASAGLVAFLGTRRGCVWVAGRLNIKGLLATSFSYVESVLAVVFSVLLLLSLHAASWFIRIHRVAFRAILTHRHIGFCFAFLYGFPFLLFCTNGPTAMVTTFRVILPLVFLVEGISHHSFLLDLNGAELLLTSFIISALKTSNLCSPIFFLSLATQCLLAVFLGSELVVQWLQLALALYSLHLMAATDDEWVGIGDDEEELSCHPVKLNDSTAARWRMYVAENFAKVIAMKYFIAKVWKATDVYSSSSVWEGPSTF
ncbi:uncharacterized protein IUM83_16721 [Phytophthora cinnamomi]|uniref:uncharacterized protein n=1 Tax=Phytophthora cinnamomi TaxID=4785 RepID=UPI00355A81EC|nr:hypothetical protein IUM83_16721 [Phytophthora cinnamomi]